MQLLPLPREVCGARARFLGLLVGCLRGNDGGGGAVGAWCGCGEEDGGEGDGGEGVV